MSLAVYELAAPTSEFSTSGVFTNPLRLTFDGTLGGVQEKKCFIRNDSVDHTYAGISLRPVDTSGLNLIDGTTGFSWKLSEGNDRPLEAEWDTITAGNTITFSNISDSNTYLPFWARVEVPRATTVRSMDQVMLEISATETLII